VQAFANRSLWPEMYRRNDCFFFHIEKNVAPGIAGLVQNFIKCLLSLPPCLKWDLRLG
jgi:hypothetical protein